MGDSAGDGRKLIWARNIGQPSQNLSILSLAAHVKVVTGGDCLVQ